MFFGWRVVGAAFIVALFAWGIGFYGLPIFVQTLHAEHGWPIVLISGAITCHFALGAAVIANLAGLHRRFGVKAVTRAGVVLTALGLVGWGLAQTPWQLFAATVPSGAGWALTSGAALNAMVAPWFVRGRPAALSMAYNGASLGGVVFSPLWVALIAWMGLGRAAIAVAVATLGVMWILAGRYLGREPAELGLGPDGGAATAGNFCEADGAGAAAAPPSPRRALWRDRRFSTLAVAASLSLFAQIGLVAQLFSLLAMAIGAAAAASVLALTPACAVFGRVVLGAMLRPGVDRRGAAAANLALQAAGSAALILSRGHAAPLLVVGCLLFGLGLGNVSSLPPLLAQSDFAPQDVPRVVALVTACSQLTYAFAPLAFGAIRSWGGAEGASWLFAAALAIQLAAALVFLAGRRSRRVAATFAPAGEMDQMLQLRPNCECCNRDLPPDSREAMICSYECTFCRSCAATYFAGRCPNCGGELVRRPMRPPERLLRHPAATERVLKPHPECAPAAG
jgi:MFS family permease